MTSVAIVDYGLGNLFSVHRAFETLGAQALITSDPRELTAADAIVIPGVGAFGEGIQNLDERGLVAPIQQLAQEGKPTLGICLGMQLLMNESEEFGRWEGLGLIPGRVVTLQSSDSAVVKVPQIGWNSVEAPARGVNGWDSTPLRSIDPGTFMYFVHSYCVQTSSASDTVAETEYGGVRFSSVAVKDNVVGCQFHPEKSGAAGLRFLSNFLGSLRG
jgi:glutamine amidotransferase